MIALDDIDRALIRAMRADSSRSAALLGEQVGLSQPACWRRIDRLMKSGVIRSRRVRLNGEKLGFGVTVFLGVKLAVRGRTSLEEFERAVSAIPEVLIVHHVLGLYDYRLKVVARDLADFERILRRRIMTLPAVGDIESNVQLSEEKDSGPLV